MKPSKNFYKRQRLLSFAVLNKKGHVVEYEFVPCGNGLALYKNHVEQHTVIEPLKNGWGVLADDGASISYGKTLAEALENYKAATIKDLKEIAL